VSNIFVVPNDYLYSSLSVRGGVKMKRTTLAAMLLFVLVGSCSAQNARKAPSVPLRIPHLQVVNEKGQRVWFDTEVVRERVAVIGTVFTTCTTICPIIGVNYARLAKALGDRLGRDVILISVSVDPTNDTPERLKAWRNERYAGVGWTLLTGEKTDIDLLLKSLGLFVPALQDHQSTILIGSVDTGWTRASALASADTWLKAIDSLRPTNVKARE
jgi:protein SCO1/2